MKDWNKDLVKSLVILGVLGELCDFSSIIGTKVYQELYRELDERLWEQVNVFLRDVILRERNTSRNGLL